MGRRLDTDWHVLEHGPLVPVTDNLWWVEGELPNMGLRRTMVVARTDVGELALHSAIALNEEGMAQLERLGNPAYLIVPNGWHCLDAARYKARYPDLKVIVPHKARKMVAGKVQAVDGTYDDFPTLDAAGTIRLEHIDRQRHVEGVMVVRSNDGVTLVFGDSLFNLPHRPGLWWWLYGRVLGSTGGPRVTAIGRAMMLLTRSKGAFRALLRRYADNNEVVRLVPGHGAMVTEHAAQALSDVADSLT